MSPLTTTGTCTRVTWLGMASSVPTHCTLWTTQIMRASKAWLYWVRVTLIGTTGPTAFLGRSAPSSCCVRTAVPQWAAVASSWSFLASCVGIGSCPE
jgi:hypothetical protein